jgi:hypothetical protein
MHGSLAGTYPATNSDTFTSRDRRLFSLSAECIRRVMVRTSVQRTTSSMVWECRLFGPWADIQARKNTYHQ